jgi:uncharacterized phage-associated protein
MFSAKTLSNNILKRAFEEDIPITAMKLQRILYIVCKKYMVETNKRLISEDFMAWRYGPVVISVYDYFKCLKTNHITCFIRDCQDHVWTVDEYSDTKLHYILEDVWRNYKSYNGIELSKFIANNDVNYQYAIDNSCETIDLGIPHN